MNEHTSENGDTSAKRVKTRSFQKWRPRSILSPEQSRRQSEVLRCAHQNLPSREMIVAFLNSYNQRLEGIPLQLALESDKGLYDVAEFLLNPNARKEPDATFGASP